MYSSVDKTTSKSCLRWHTAQGRTTDARSETLGDRRFRAPL